MTAPHELKMALSIKRSFADANIDPANVQTLNEANLIRNLYSRLTEFNTQGELVTSAAQEFNINSDNISFKIREDLKSSDGLKLTAEDVYLSFKRLIVLGENTHGDLRHLLCGSKPPRKIEDPCEGLSFDSERFIVKPIESTKLKYLASLFASVDFSIVPKSCVDWNSPKLPIISRTVTSGAYFVDVDLDANNRKAVLSSNEFFFRTNPKRPSKISIFSANREEAAELFRKGSIDFLPSSFSWDKKSYQELSALNDTKTHETFPINLWSLRFTKPGIDRTSIDLRLFLGKIFRSRFSKIYPNESLQASREMFPSLSEGSLSPEQIRELDLYMDKHILERADQVVVLGIPQGQIERYQEALGDLPWIKYMELVKAPWTLEPAEQPDFYLTFGDSSFFEDLSMISNHMAMGTFNMNKEESEKWIDTYLSTNEKIERLRLLKDLHLKTLMNAYIVPVGFTPFFAFSRNGWVMKFSKYYVGNPYWQVEWTN